jgi:small subunit ribosomal protein S1
MSSPEPQPPQPAADAPPDEGAAPGPPDVAPVENVAASSAALSSNEAKTNGHHVAADAGQPLAAPVAEPAAPPPAAPSPVFDPSGQGEGTAQAEGTAHGEPHAEKKRRRRRRKKKHGTAQASEVGQAAQHEDGPHEPHDVGSPDEGGEEPADAQAPHEGTVPPAKKKKKEKKAPPRERPPVNVGDIVFGKVLSITDEAILVDIPGKAHAIFDRREMLLPDEDDSPPRPRAYDEPRPAAAIAAPAASLDANEATGAMGAPVESDTQTDANAQAEPTAHQEPAREAVAASETSAPATTEAPAAVLTEAVAATEAPVKEPTLPRVILEAGADFIAVVHNDGGRGGLVVLTHHPNRAERARPLVEKAFNEKTVVEGLVTGVIKGGVEVDVDGLRAFAPGSHVDLRLGVDLSHLVAQRLPFVVTQYAKRGRDLVLSRRAILEEEAQKARAEALARLKPGEELEGTVRSVVAFGAFVDVGGVEGLVPLQEMSHNRSEGPAQVFKVGESTRVKVTRIDERGKVWLSRKATIADPWQQVAQKYAVGTKHAGKVVRIQPFGAFVELEPGVDGLIHTADLSIKRIESPNDVVKVDDPIDVVVAHVDPVQHKIGLHPALQGDAANEAPQRVQPHKPVKAKVVTIESGGLVVRLTGVTGRNARGYITAAGTGTPRGTELRKAFTVGQEVEAKVIELDPRRGEVKLSMKALSEDQERSAYQQYRQQLKAEARFTFGDLLAKKK